MDFHACRVAYINLIMESGATAKEAQELARHATPHMTMNVYGRAREDRLALAVENVANRIQSEQKHVPSMYRQAVSAEIENATPLENTRLRPIRNGGAEGNRTPDLLNAIQALSQLSYGPNANQKPMLSKSYGADGTRTRGLRCDRPAL